MNYSDPIDRQLIDIAAMVGAKSKYDGISVLLCFMIAAIVVVYGAFFCCIFTHELIIGRFTTMPSPVWERADDAVADEPQPRCSTTPHPFSNRRAYAAL